MPEYLLRFPWPSKWLSPNKKDGTSTARMAHYSAKKRAKNDAWAIAREAGLRDPMPDAALHFTYHPPDNRRRDASNLPFMLKATIDGIALAMGCDDQGFRVHYPAQFDGVIKGGEIVCLVVPNTVEIEHRGLVS